MSESQPPAPFQRWMGYAILGLLSLQVGLGWIHGQLLHRQHGDLAVLRLEMQNLSESLEENAAGAVPQDESLVPLRSRRDRRGSLQRVARMQEPTQEAPKEEKPEADQAAKEAKDARESAQKAVAKARDAQSKLSIEENARKAEEKAKLQEAENRWTKYAGWGIVIALLALAARAFIRRRG
jgi:hypothetical protein